MGAKPPIEVLSSFGGREEKGVARWFRISPVGISGGLIFALGTALDLLAHLAPPGWQLLLERYLGSGGAHAHLVTFVGMLLILASVLQTASGVGAYRGSPRR